MKKPTPASFRSHRPGTVCLRWLPLLSVLGALSSLPTPAQQPPPPTPPPPAKEAPDIPIELSPFVVSTNRDVGYLAQSSLSGSRLNTDLKDVGSPISTFTLEFLQDVATTDTDELAKYMLSVEYEPVEYQGNQHSKP